MKVQVKNLDHREYREMFREEEIVIPAGESVEMGRSEAVAFLGQFIPMVKDGGDRPLRPKMLKIIEDPEQHAAARAQPERYEAVDGTLFRTPEGLRNYQEKLNAEAQTTKEEVTNEQPAPKRRTRVTTAKR